MADCAALALAARPTRQRPDRRAATAGGLALAEALATVAAATTVDEVLAAALEVAAARFGARAGFVCLPSRPGRRRGRRAGEGSTGTGSAPPAATPASPG